MSFETVVGSGGLVAVTDNPGFAEELSDG